MDEIQTNSCLQLSQTVLRPDSLVRLTIKQSCPISPSRSATHLPIIAAGAAARLGAMAVLSGSSKATTIIHKQTHAMKLVVCTDSK